MSHRSLSKVNLHNIRRIFTIAITLELRKIFTNFMTIVDTWSSNFMTIADTWSSSFMTIVDTWSSNFQYLVALTSSEK